MDIRPRFSLVAVLVLAFALAACGDDDNPATPNDTTPPGVSTVTPVDDHHIDITFSEQVTKSSAEDESNYTIIPAPVPVSPKRGVAAAGGVSVVGATLKGDNKTVTVATGSSMAGLNLQVTVHNVSDMTGNKIGEAGSGKSFTGSDTVDETAPSEVSHAPLSNATNIAVNATVVVNFSEAISTASALWVAGPGAGAASGNVSSNAQGGVSFTQSIDGAKLTLTLTQQLAYSQLYTVTVNADDFAGNQSGTIQWSFTTAANNDRTPPTLVSTVPANLAANVNVNSNLSITFSEAIYQGDFNVQLVPDPGAGLATWSNGGKTVTFDPTNPLQTNTQYTLTIFPKGVFDLAGNGILGLHTVTFTTAAQLAGGSIAGTIAGDAGTQAADPTGATVIAADVSPFDNDSFHVFASAKVATNDTYTLPYLPDGLYYYIISVKDTNGDGDLDPSDGDAIGAYGVDFATQDFNPDSVVIDGGAHVTGRNFGLYDPSTARGTITYNGAFVGEPIVYVGLFETTGFSLDATPVFGVPAYGPDFAWSFSTLEDLIPEGDYYLAAFMDTNNNQSYDAAVEPAGLYGTLAQPTVVHMSNGTDTKNISFEVVDVPGAPASSTSVVWPRAKHNTAFQRLAAAVRQSQQQMSR